MKILVFVLRIVFCLLEKQKPKDKKELLLFVEADRNKSNLMKFNNVWCKIQDEKHFNSIKFTSKLSTFSHTRKTVFVFFFVWYMQGAMNERNIRRQKKL